MLWIFYFLIRRIFSKQLQWRRHIRYSGYFAFPLTSRSSVPIPISVEIFSSIYFQIQNISLQPNLTNFKNSFLILETLNISETNGDLCDLMHDPQSHTPIPTQPRPSFKDKCGNKQNINLIQMLLLRVGPIWKISFCFLELAFVGTFSFSEVIHIGTRTLIWRQTCWPLNRLLHKIVQIKLGDDLFKTTDRCGQSSKVSTIIIYDLRDVIFGSFRRKCHKLQSYHPL